MFIIIYLFALNFLTIGLVIDIREHGLNKIVEVHP